MMHPVVIPRAARHGAAPERPKDPSKTVNYGCGGIGVGVHGGRTGIRVAT